MGQNFMVVASKITEMMRPDPRLWDSTTKMNMAHLSVLCGKKAQESGGKVYDVDEVLEAFPKLQAELSEKGYTCNLLTLLKGTPKNIDRLLEVEPAPPVYDSFAHSQWVKRNAKRLKKMKWCYNGWSRESDQFDGSRLSFEEVSRLGLLPH